MGKDTFDAVLASVPMSRTAAQVTARGEHYTPETPMPVGLRHWESQPLLKPFAPDARGLAIDLAGKKFGRFTVVGMLAEANANTGGGNVWVCKCSCGRYEGRKGSAIKFALAGVVNTQGAGHRCWYCTQWETTRLRYEKHGAKALSEFTVEKKPRVIAARSFLAIIADQIAARFNVDDEVARAAAMAINSEIMRGGYRVVRERTADPQTPSEPQ